MTDFYRICRECNKPSLTKTPLCSHCGKPLHSEVEIVFSYAHEDEKLLNELIKHLTILRRTGLAMLWYDQNISKGSEWEKTIDIHFNTADIILLLISSDFIASDFCYSTEMERAMERHRRNEACVIPVILRPTSWHHTPFAALQAVPKNAQPVTTSKNRDEALLDVVQGIQGVLKERFGLTPKK